MLATLITDWFRWTSDLAEPAPVYTSSTYRPWRRVDVSAFQDALRLSALCSIVNESRDDDAEQLAALYDSMINAIAYRLVPSVGIVRRLTLGLTMIVSLFAVDVADLSAERSGTRSLWMRLVRNCGCIVH
jgi:hypothetical protein